MAGTGKSAIARTICKNLSDAHLLGGSFFCSRRGSSDERDITRIIPTLTSHLARLDADYRREVVECLSREPDIASATVDMQLDELLAKPMSCALRRLQTPLILVIDALDEGAEAYEAAKLLETILRKAPNLPVRFFITSRPESHIREKFLRPGTRQTVLYLHEIEESMAKADIELYIAHRLRKIKNESTVLLPEEWPTDLQVETLASHADKLVLYAVLACDWISRHPIRRLNKVIEQTRMEELSTSSRLDSMYALILDDAMDPSFIAPNTVIGIRKCLTLLHILRTVSVDKLAKFLKKELDEIRTMLNDLDVLFMVPLSDDEPVRMAHVSLRDYLANDDNLKHHSIMTQEEYIARLVDHMKY
jgi:hypothetical protein